MSREDDAFASTFKGILIFLVILLVVLIVLANMIADDDDAPVAGGPAPETIKPVGKVKLAATDLAPAPAAKVSAAPAAAAASGSADGKATFTAACSACHSSGAAGAPKLGDRAAWVGRIAQGMAVMQDHAIKGFQGKKGFMPAKGGRADLSDIAVKAAVVYMVGESK
ncbi:MAG: hypothetical protein BMS9Abin26_1169 [Gammaproteobacteria bacterium]|nr:MAG: hypothetical protein BMS9Abin26_1169 [Gammaproteobacteria bacterium]